MREQLWLGRSSGGKLIAQNLSRAAMQSLAAALKQVFISRILNECGKAGQRSLARAALLEGTEQIKRALDQIATLPATPALHREEIKLQLAFGNALTLMGHTLWTANTTSTGRSRFCMR